MKAIPQEMQLGPTLASCPSYLLKFEKIDGNLQCIFITNYFTVFETFTEEDHECPPHSRWSLGEKSLLMTISCQQLCVDTCQQLMLNE